VPERRRQAAADGRARPLHLLRPGHRPPALRGRGHAGRSPPPGGPARVLPPRRARHQARLGRRGHRQRHPRQEPPPGGHLRRARAPPCLAQVRREARRAGSRGPALSRHRRRPRAHGADHLGGDRAPSDPGGGSARRGDPVRRHRRIPLALRPGRRGVRVHGGVARRRFARAAGHLLPGKSCRGRDPGAGAARDRPRGPAAGQRSHRPRLQCRLLRGAEARRPLAAPALGSILLSPRRRRSLEPALRPARVPAVPVRRPDGGSAAQAARGGAGVSAHRPQAVRERAVARDPLLPPARVHARARRAERGRGDLRAPGAAGGDRHGSRRRALPGEGRADVAATFARSYPRLEEFRRFIDPAFSSSFWRRVTQ